MNGSTIECAPIALFVFNRPAHALRTLESLAANRLADQSELFIYADGVPTDATDACRINMQKVREIIRSRPWCGKVTVVERNEHMGLATSILSGVRELLDRKTKVIVLEDDLHLSPAFLTYMNEALVLYEADERVMQVSGYMFPVEEELNETFFLGLTTTWGWATWRRAFRQFESDAKHLLKQIQATGSTRAFNLDGAYDYTRQLTANAEGRLRTWGVLWYATVFLAHGLCLYPRRSLVENMGHDGSGANCKTTDSRFQAAALVEEIVVRRHEVIEADSARRAVRTFVRNSREKNVSEHRSDMSFRRGLISYLIRVLRLDEALEDLRREKQLASCMRNTTATKDVFLPEAKVENFQNSPDAIRIGQRTRVRGELLVFPYGGKIVIGTDCYLGEHSRIWSGESVRIGNHVLIAHNVNIIDTTAHEIDSTQRAASYQRLIQEGHLTEKGSVATAPITIGDHAWINFNAVILRGVNIGEGAIVAASSVVTKDVPPFCMVAGNPAKVIKQLKTM